MEDGKKETICGNTKVGYVLAVRKIVVNVCLTGTKLCTLEFEFHCVDFLTKLGNIFKYNLK